MKNSFKEKVYKLTRAIPKGYVATYGQIAGLSGNPKAARAVGVLMKLNPDPTGIPCHRVVSVDGSLTGYSGKGGIERKKAVLLSEGVKFTGNRVDLSKSGWKI